MLLSAVFSRLLVKIKTATILCISNEDHVTNEEVCAKIQRAFGQHEDLLTIVTDGQNHLTGHNGREKKTRQTEKKRWETTSRNGQAWSSPSPRRQLRTEKKMRKLAVKSSAVPQRPLLLRDR